MPLVTSKEMFEKAYNGGYAIGAFNVNNMEIIQGITEAAKECNAPVILQVSKGARAYANRTYLVKLVEAAVIETGLPIVLHLDHGDSFETCKSCIDDGFTSVMIDASSKPFEENIEITRKARQKILPIPVRKTLKSLSEEQAATPWRSPSAQATAHSSSSRNSAQEMKRAFSFRRRCASTFSKTYPDVCRDSRSFCTDLLPYRRNMSR